MYQSEITNYLSGVMDMACSISRRISFSSIRVTCFKKKGFRKEFSRLYDINDELELKEIKGDLFYKLFGWLGREKIVIRLVELIKHEVGDVLHIYKSNDLVINMLSGCENGVSGFYFVEDLFFIETDKYMVCFILGNNE